MSFTRAAAAAAIMFASSAALAQDATSPLAACSADAQSLCGTTATGDGGRMRCLRDNEAKLSADCKAALTRIREAREAVRNACQSDVDSLCKDAAGKDGERGQGLRCLRDNASKVSKACAEALALLPQWGGRADAQPAAASAEKK